MNKGKKSAAPTDPNISAPTSQKDLDKQTDSKSQLPNQKDINKLTDSKLQSPNLLNQKDTLEPTDSKSNTPSILSNQKDIDKPTNSKVQLTGKDKEIRKKDTKELPKEVAKELPKELPNELPKELPKEVQNETTPKSPEYHKMKVDPSEFHHKYQNFLEEDRENKRKQVKYYEYLFF